MSKRMNIQISSEIHKALSETLKYGDTIKDFVESAILEKLKENNFPYKIICFTCLPNEPYMIECCRGDGSGESPFRFECPKCDNVILVFKELRGEK